jgi:hypothetical protein
MVQPTVRDSSAEIVAMSESWPLIQALLGGTPAMRKKGEEFLPRWPNEEKSAYDARLRVATLFPAFQRTVEVLAGKPFAKPLTLGKDVPARIGDKKNGWATDIDLQGRNLHAFAAGLCEEALAYGLSGILVDYPKTDGLRTVAEEAAAGVRPYFVQIHPQNILGWKSERINGAETLTQLRLLECAKEDDGEWGEKEVEQVRVLYPGRWETYRESSETGADGKKKWVLFEEGATTLKTIPFVPVYAKRKDYMEATPPLLELAFLNVEHWQSKSDQQTILHVARVPILFAKQLGEAPITVGANVAIKAENQDADLKFVEHSGKSIDAGRQSLQDLEDQMRQVGAELLVIKSAHTTEAQTLADNEQGTSAMQRIARDLEDAINAALQLMADWVGEPDGGHATVFSDFGAATLAEASAELLQKMNLAGTLSDQTLFEEMQRRAIIRPELQWDEEEQRITSQPPKFGAFAGIGAMDGQGKQGNQGAQ